MIYTYFISYSHNKGNGCMELFRNKKIKTFDDIKSINKFIEDTYKLKQVIVNNYILLNKKIGKLK